MPLILMILAILLSGCGLSSALREANDVANPSISGELAIRSAQGEPIDWKPDACLSGEHEQFFGFILRSDGSPVVLRAVVDPLDGPGFASLDSQRPEWSSGRNSVRNWSWS